MNGIIPPEAPANQEVLPLDERAAWILVGKQAAKVFAEQGYHTIGQIRELAKTGGLLAIPGVGKVTAQKVIDGLKLAERMND